MVYGPIARAERGSMRWRDIQWVDFTSGPESVDPLANGNKADGPANTPAARTAAATPNVAHALHRFAQRSPTPAKAAIPGLAPRFTRLPVPLVLPPPPPAEPRGIAQLLAMRKSSRVMHHSRQPTPAAAPLNATLEPTETTAPTVAVLDDGCACFPASIYISTSASLPVEATPSFRAALTTRLSRVSARLRVESEHAGAALTDGFGRAVTELRSKSRLVAAALADRFGHAGTVLRTRVSQDVPAAVFKFGPRRRQTRMPIAGMVAPPPPRKLAIPPRLASPAAKPPHRGAVADPQLRITGPAALAGVSIAITIYLGGALIVGLPGTAPPKTATKQSPSLSEPVGAAPAPPAAPKTPAPKTPPNEPAARAALYLARAKAGDAAAQYDVGLLYARGDGLVQDYASAASWFHAAAAQGNVAAQYNLGVLYERGDGVTADPAEALNWYRSAADQNHARAQFNLALAYAEGRGIRQDFAAASRWYLRAAEQGLAPAMVNLAILYERGDGVEKSLIEAYAWYSAAGERDDTEAKNRAAKLFHQFGDKEKARAQGLAATIAAALDAKAPKA